jgi:gas vesicle protein
MDAYTQDPQDHRDYRFVIGLVAGTVVGAGLMMWLAPRTASELRGRLTDTARNLGDRLTRKGQGVRDDVADAVARGAHEVERYATSAKTDQAAQDGKPSGAARPVAAPRAV